jgi:L-fuculose-phosphate aldolase
VVGGKDIYDAFQKFETLEFCARIQIEGASIGKVKSLTQDQIDLFYNRKREIPDFVHFSPSPLEAQMRGELCHIVNRAYRQRLIISTYGTFSVRLSGDEFLITPYGKDRYYLERDDLVLVKEGKKERGKIPSRSVKLHARIYQDHPEVSSVITAQSPNATAYCVTGKTFDTRTIPESYILLREIPLVPYGDQFREGEDISRRLSPDTPILLLENDSLLVTGKSLMETFDRLEVAEFTARSLTQSRKLGELIPMKETEIDDLKKKFLAGEK